MFESQHNEDAETFANEFLRRYTAVGFGALSKREIDLMVLQLLQNLLPDFRATTDFDAAILLRTTKRKIRGLRDEISFREGHRHNEDALKTILKKTLLRAEIIHDRQGTVMLQIDDAVLRGYAEKLIRAEYGIIDTSFNSAILKLSGEKFLLLAYSVLDKGNRSKADEVVAKMRAVEHFQPESKKSEFSNFKDGFLFGAGQRAGQLSISGAMALLTNGTSIVLEGVEPVKVAGRSLAVALRSAKEFFLESSV